MTVDVVQTHWNELQGASSFGASTHYARLVALSRPDLPHVRPGVAKAVALRLVDMARRAESWTTPFVAVEDLAAATSFSRRHVQRALHGLEALGLVRIEARSGRPSAYQLPPERWRDRATADSTARRAELQEREAVAIRSPAHLPGPRVADGLPAWVPFVPQGAQATREELFRAVVRVGRAFGGAAVAHEPDAALGGALRRVVRLWRSLGWCSLARLVEDAELIAEAWHGGGVAVWDKLRAAGKSGLRLLGPSWWQGNLQLARAWAAAPAAVEPLEVVELPGPAVEAVEETWHGLRERLGEHLLIRLRAAGRLEVRARAGALEAITSVAYAWSDLRDQELEAAAAAIGRLRLVLVPDR